MTVQPVRFWSGTSSGSPILLPVPISPVTQYGRVILENLTALATLGSSAVSFRWEFYTGMANGSAYADKYLGGSTNPSTVTKAFAAAPNGFSFINNNAPSVVATASASAFNPGASTTIVIGSATGVPSSGVVRINWATGMSQINGMYFYYTLSGTTVTLPYLNTVGYAAGTTGSLSFISNYGTQFSTIAQGITDIITGSTTTVQFGTQHPYQVGEYIQLNIPALYGAQLAQFLNWQTGVPNATRVNNAGYQILSTDASTVTLAVNTVGQGAFAFPTNAEVQALTGKVQNTFPQAIYAGFNPSVILAQNASQFTSGGTILELGSAIVGSSGDLLNLYIESDTLLATY